MERHRTPRASGRALLAPLSLLYLLLVGCPHRTPKFSPDNSRVLVLAGPAGEAVEEPASQLWIARPDSEDSAARRIPPPAAADTGLRFLAAEWLDNETVLAATATWEDGEAAEESAALWTLSTAGSTWTRLELPRPSAERTPRRPPVIAPPSAGEPRRYMAYAVGAEKVVAAELGDTAAVVAETEPAELVGLGPGGGFLLYRSNEETGDIDLVACNRKLEPQWTRPFSELAASIAEALGVSRIEVVFNDANRSTWRAGGERLGVQLVFTDVSWKEGVSGYYALLGGADGRLLAVRGGRSYPGDPGLAAAAEGGWVWAVSPTTPRGATTGSLRAYPLAAAADDDSDGDARDDSDGDEPAKADVTSIELAGVDPKAIHGFALSHDAKRFAVVFHGETTRLVVYPVASGKIAGEPAEVRLKAE